MILPRLSLLLTLSSLIASCAADFATRNEVYSCLRTTTKGIAAHTNATSVLASVLYCYDKLFWISSYVCLHELAPSKVGQLYPYLDEYCEGVLPDEDTLVEYYDNATETNWVVDFYSLAKGQIVDAPITPNKTAYAFSMDYFVPMYTEIENGNYFAKAILGYWGFIMVFGIVYNFMSKATPGALMSVQINFIRKHLILPAAITKRHSRPIPFIGYMPTRIQSLVVFIHVLMNILMVSICYYEYKADNIYGYSKYITRLLMLSHRSAIMSFGQLPLVFLFASRNNVLAWITGWSFDTFNVYHRWVSRTMFLHAAIHSVAWTMYGHNRAYLDLYWAQPYWRWGAAATIVGGVMLGQAWQFFRQHAYELFLATHILLAIAFIAGCYYHVTLIDFTFEEYCWAAIAFWAFDRALRFVRLVLNGGMLKTSFEARGSDVFRADIKYWKTWAFFPGAHIYVYVMLPTGFWQSHPFTVFQSNLPGEEGHIILLGKKKHGITNSIYKRLANSSSHRSDLRIFVEGPYGTHHHLHAFDSAVLIAGGIGITAVFPYALELASTNSGKQRVVVRWVIHDEDALTWMPQELNSLLANSAIDLQVFITAPGTSSSPTTEKLPLQSDSDAEKSSAASSNSLALASPSLQIIHQRPDMLSLIPALISQPDIASGSVGVLVCGLPGMNDDARAAVANSLELATGKVEYFEEAFAW
ncbi:ferric reductase like transmembrane component-domain-containing protein [Myxozyma melibiosi]|uniref:Ferric reductase like transmembrane component-domain-containing protein n=1 Tax=Myxozyma melibiosi TaxID=54550 RepID=A0ABR1FAX1_9ASCO